MLTAPPRMHYMAPETFVRNSSALRHHLSGRRPTMSSPSKGSSCERSSGFTLLPSLLRRNKSLPSRDEASPGVGAAERAGSLSSGARTRPCCSGRRRSPTPSVRAMLTCPRWANHVVFLPLGKTFKFCPCQGRSPKQAASCRPKSLLSRLWETATK